jgi:hypothetical protein
MGIDKYQKFKSRNMSASYAKYRNPSVFRPKNSKNKIQFNFGYLKYVLYIVIILLGAYFLFYSKYFEIKEVIIEGNSLLTREQIKADMPAGGNIFLFDSEKLKNTIMTKYPEIKRIDLYRGLPNALKVVVVERDGKLVWQSGDNKYLISSDGDVTRQIVGTEGDGMPVVTDKRALPVETGKRLLSPNFIAFIINVNAGFFEETNIKPKDFMIDETTFDVSLNTEAGFYVKLNSLRSSKKQLGSLKLILVEKRQDIKEYVDLRIDGWAYYK